MKPYLTAWAKHPRNTVSNLVFEWMWSQIITDIEPHRRSTYRAILSGAWQGKTYAEIAKDLQYSEVYLRQDLASHLWTILSKKFKIPLSKKTFKATLSTQYEAAQASKFTSTLSSRTDITTSAGSKLSLPFGDRTS